MLGVIATHLGMLIAMYIVLALVGLSIVARLIMDLRGKADFSTMADVVVHPVLHRVFPLIILAWLTTIDPTHILMKIWYFVAAALIAIQALLSLSRFVRR